MNAVAEREQVAEALGKAELGVRRAQRRGDGREVARLKQLIAELEVRGRALLKADDDNAAL